MAGIIGNIGLSLAFVFALAATFFYLYATKTENIQHLKRAHWLFAFKSFSMLLASGALIYALLNHQFNYFYVFNYTSKDLPLRYLFSAFYGGQEGSFMLWILWSALVGWGIVRWTDKRLLAPTMFFLTLTQVFLIAMVLGWDVFGIHIGASPFRSLAEAMPDAPFLQANPDFVPADGKGLNDLLRSPWMMIHPPILFLGFSMMTLPFAFALAGLWKQDYVSWMRPALPWTLGANLCLFIAIFLGGYWAYVTLSFGGFWAWDPVENASLVPWLFGVAGIHVMLVQNKQKRFGKSAFIFPVLAYLTIVYETFLTRSGVLEDASVHSFVDLGLYNQLLIFMLLITFLSIGFIAYRWKAFPKVNASEKVLSRDFLMFTAAVLLLILGIVILVGTSSPILGKLFVTKPTPPPQSFYNNWSMPLAMLMLVFSVIGQYVWWKRYGSDQLSAALVMPSVITSMFSIIIVVGLEIKNPLHMILVVTSVFAVVGNANIVIDLLKRSPKMAGGALSHVGFALLVIGALISGVKNLPLLDEETQNYNLAVEQGLVKDDNGFPVLQGVEIVKLIKNEPKVLNDYEVTYTGMTIQNGDKQGEQKYTLRFAPAEGSGYSFTMNPIAFPMMAGSSAEEINWGVDPEVYPGFLSDIYVYVAGSTIIERMNEDIERRNSIFPVSQEAQESSVFRMKQNDTLHVASYHIYFHGFEQVPEDERPDGTVVAIKAVLDVLAEDGVTYRIKPAYAIVDQEGDKYAWNQPAAIEERGLRVHFNNVNPNTDEIEIELFGLGSVKIADEEDWVLVVAERKPLISMVWLGTFLLMIGFSVSIMRRWYEANPNYKGKVESKPATV